MVNAASSIGDHVDLWRTPLHQPAIMLIFAYLRRPPTTHMEIAVSSTILLTYYLFVSLTPLSIEYSVLCLAFRNNLDNLNISETLHYIICLFQNIILVLLSKIYSHQTNCSFTFPTYLSQILDETWCFLVNSAYECLAKHKRGPHLDVFKYL